MEPFVKRRRQMPLFPTNATPLPSLSLMLHRNKPSWPSPPASVMVQPTEPIQPLSLLGIAAQMRSPVASPHMEPQQEADGHIQQRFMQLAPIDSSISATQTSEKIERNSPSTSPFRGIDSRIPRLHGTYAGLAHDKSNSRQAPKMTRQERIARWKRKRLQKSRKSSTNQSSHQRVPVVRARVHGRFASSQVFVPITALQN
ncbi:hypothetical protein Ae201684P_001261 [Aphanomyces euteiches]|nr:hypothetical protein Ae201684P_001261 [Aphanomyces euteiches]